MKIILFDIDGTLIHSGGSGMRAMTLAFEEVFGIEKGINGIQLAGRTDTLILMDAFERTDIIWSIDHETRFKERYFTLIKQELEIPNPRQRIMPGIPMLLDRLREREDIHLGLLTGNWAKSAELKLIHFDLWKYFGFGAFSDDEGDRNKLLPYSVRRAEEKFDIRVQSDHIFVIGDTPADVQCARPHHAVAVAVATGNYTREQLQTEKPHFLFDDLSDIDSVMAVFD